MTLYTRRFGSWSLLLKGIGIVLFLWILTHIDSAQFVRSLASASFPFLLLGWLLFPAIYALKAARWHFFLRRAGIEQSYLTSYKTYCSALFLGTVTPGNVGETIKISFLHSAGASLKTATALTLLDRLYDVLWIGLFALPAVYFLLPDRLLVLVVLLAGIGIALFVLRTLLKRSGENPRHLLSYGFQWQPHLWTIANWSLYFLQQLIFARALNLTVPVPPFIGIMTLAGIANLLAIAPAGLGTRDAVVLYFFSAYGIPAPLTVAFSFSIFVLTLLGSLIGLGFWLRLPPLKKPTSSTSGGEAAIL
jgi:uncharacterized membrane protein YbhN (UPF0104 family)